MITSLERAVDAPDKPLLYATGTCFDDAIDFMNLMAAKEPWNIKKMNKQWRIVHGICLLDDERRYSHCWITRLNSCFDFRIYKDEKVLVQYARHEFKTLFRPQKEVIYTLKDYCHLEKRVYGYPGPWDPEIRNLCPDVKKST